MKDGYERELLSKTIDYLRKIPVTRRFMLLPNDIECLQLFTMWCSLLLSLIIAVFIFTLEDY